MAKYEKGSLRFTEFLLLVLTWAVELVLVAAPALNDQWNERVGLLPALIGFFCATWLTKVLLTGEVED